MKLKVGHYVSGKHSPFVHGKIVKIEGEFIRLDDGSVYPRIALQKSLRRINKVLPTFGKSLRKSRNGLHF